MQAEVLECPTLFVAGFDFFGDPFRNHGGWSADNEIGRLWQRWGDYLDQNPALLKTMPEPGIMYEVHVYHAETMKTGEFEVLVGLKIEPAALATLPPTVVVKSLAGGRYARLMLRGEEIVSDWIWQLDTEWLPALGVQRQLTFSFQRYDARFKGMDRIAESELDVYLPLYP